MRRVLTVLFWAIISPFLSLFSQNVVFEYPIDLKSGESESRAAYSFTSHEGRNLALFLMDERKLNAVLINQDFHKVKELETTRPSKPFHNSILGHLHAMNKYSLFFVSAGRNKLAYLSFDFNKDTVEDHLVNIPFGKEKILTGFSLDNKFNVLTTNPETYTFHLYEFSTPQKHTRKSFKLEDYEEFYEEFLNQVGPGWKLTSFPFDATHSLAHSIGGGKVFYDQSKIWITLDNNPRHTTLLGLNKEKEKVSVKRYEQEFFKRNKSVDVLSNSIVFDQKLWQVKANRKQLSMNVWDLGNDRVVESITSTPSNGFPLANGDFTFREKDGRELFAEKSDNPKKFLKKLSLYNLGIAAHRTENQEIQFTIGGFWTEKSIGNIDNQVFLRTNSPTPNVYNNRVINYSPDSDEYLNFLNGNYLYFYSLFDRNRVKHKDNQVSGGIYDRLQAVQETITNERLASVLVNRMGKYYYGYYSAIGNQYNIVEIK